MNEQTYNSQYRSIAAIYLPSGGKICDTFSTVSNKLNE